MAVSEADYADHEDTIKQLFQEYHEWNKRGVVDTLGGHLAPVHEVEQSYDIDALIRGDAAKLAGLETDTRLFIATENDEIVGCAFLDQRSDRVAEVKRLYVRPVARGGGLGRSLMEAVLTAAREDGYSRLLLFTNPFTQAAQSLYEDLGFEYTDPFECEAPEEAYDDLIFMELDLD